MACKRQLELSSDYSSEEGHDDFAFGGRKIHEKITRWADKIQLHMATLPASKQKELLKAFFSKRLKVTGPAPEMQP